MAIRKIRLGGEQLGRIQKKHAERAFEDKSIPEIKVEGYEERVSALENEIAFLIAAISKNLVSSDDYRLISFDNKILKAL